MVLAQMVWNKAPRMLQELKKVLSNLKMIPFRQTIHHHFGSMFHVWMTTRKSFFQNWNHQNSDPRTFLREQVIHQQFQRKKIIEHPNSGI